MSEDEAEQVALVDLAWARLWLFALKRAAELQIATADAIEGSTPGGDTDQEEADKEGRDLGPLEALAFAPLTLPSTSVRLTDLRAHAKDFDGARELFKLGSARVGRAKATLVLDGWVTMHFECLEVELELYAPLATPSIPPLATPSKEVELELCMHASRDGAARRPLMISRVHTPSLAVLAERLPPSTTTPSPQVPTARHVGARPRPQARDAQAAAPPPPAMRRGPLRKGLYSACPARLLRLRVHCV